MDQTKHRLRDAYENIEFFASNTWVNSLSIYQQANQESFARENMVQDSLHNKIKSSSPKTVRDVIPQSRLAQYLNPKYDEKRELSYRVHLRNLSFYCPCSYKRKTRKEPWMLPEVEELFIWFSFMPDFEILEIIHLEYLFDQVLPIYKPPYCLYFRQIDPKFCESCKECLNKTNVSLSEAEKEMYKPLDFKVETFEDIILRIQIKSDKVKHLWCRYSQPKLEQDTNKKCNVTTSPLGNCFLLEDDRDVENCQNDTSHESSHLLDKYRLKRSDFGQLQYLADSIRLLNTLYFTREQMEESLPLSTTTTIPYEEPNADSKNSVPTTRRLYSAVLQGLGTEDSKLGISNYLEVPDRSVLMSTDSFENNPTTSTTEKSCNIPSTVIFGNQTNLPIYTTASSQKITQTCESYNFKCRYQEQSSASYKITPPKQSNATSNSERSVNNVSNMLGVCLNMPYFANSCSNNVSLFTTTTTCSNYANNSNLNYNLNAHYSSNVMTNSGLSTQNSVPNNVYSISNGFRSSQFPLYTRASPFNRSYPTNPMQSMWFLPQNRTPPNYSVAHYTSQPYLYFSSAQQAPSSYQAPRQNQRWQYPISHVRPPHAYHTSVPQQYPAALTAHQWGMQNQNIYRVNSNPQIDANHQIEPFIQSRHRMKSQKTATNQYKFRSKSPDKLGSNYSITGKRKAGYDLPSTEKQYFIKGASSTSSLEYRRFKQQIDYKSNDYFHIGKRSSDMAVKNDSENFVSSDSDGSRTILPISSSFSEDLERQALEQYQNSNENFYQELERQAEEQYDDDRSENWICPPYKHLFNGGPICLIKRKIIIFVITVLDFHFEF